MDDIDIEIGSIGRDAGPRLARLLGEEVTTAMVTGALEAWRRADVVMTHNIVAVILLGAIENLPEDLRVLDTRPKETN